MSKITATAKRKTPTPCISSCDARSRDDLERFMQPFAQAGTVEIMPATTCEAVVERGGCDVSD